MPYRLVSLRQPITHLDVIVQKESRQDELYFDCSKEAPRACMVAISKEKVSFIG